jgi:hypothetical protein
VDHGVLENGGVQATASWSCFSGSHPSLVRACEIPDLPATFTYEAKSGWRLLEL